MLEDLLTVVEVAEILNVSAERVRQFIRVGRLQATNFGKSYLIKRTDLDSFQAQPRIRTGRPADKSLRKDNDL